MDCNWIKLILITLMSVTAFIRSFPMEHLSCNCNTTIFRFTHSLRHLKNFFATLLSNTQIDFPRLGDSQFNWLLMKLQLIAEYINKPSTGGCLQKHCGTTVGWIKHYAKVLEHLLRQKSNTQLTNTIHSRNGRTQKLSFYFLLPQYIENPNGESASVVGLSGWVNGAVSL